VSKRPRPALKQVGPGLAESGPTAPTNGLLLAGPPSPANCCCADGDALSFLPPSPSRAPELVFPRADQARLLRPPRERQSLAAACRAIARGRPLLGLSCCGCRCAQAGARARPAGPLTTGTRTARVNSPEIQPKHRENKNPETAIRAVLVEALLASEDSRFWCIPARPDRDGPALVTKRAGRQGAGTGGSTLYPAAGPTAFIANRWPGDNLVAQIGGNARALQLEARFSKGRPAC